LVDVNVRSHRAGRQGFDTGFVPIPTTEEDLVVGRAYVSGIYIANTSTAGGVQITLKETASGTIFYNKVLQAGGWDNMVFSEPMLVEGIRHVATTAGGVIKVWGYA
jgi:hypothetical protein